MPLAWAAGRLLVVHLTNRQHFSRNTDPAAFSRADSEKPFDIK
jgi:hypothetical protein